MKKFGIRGTLPPNDPMRSEHLLGDNWEWFRWYDNQPERDTALQQMREKHPYYRIGDHVSQILTKVEQ